MFPKNIQILIVDDSPTVLSHLHYLLAGMGYQNIIKAEDGEAAINQLFKYETIRHPIDLIICDWSMPRVNGMEVLHIMRKNPEWANRPFIFLTASGEVNSVCTAIEAGVDDYIIKPVNAQILAQKLATVFLKIQGSEHQKKSS